MLGSFLEALEEVLGIGAKCYFSDVDISVSAEHQAEVLLRCDLARCGKLDGCADRSCLGSLSACVGVQLVVDDENIDVLTGGHNVIKSAIAYVVCPAVSAEHPHCLLGQLILSVAQESDICIIVFSLFQSFSYCVGDFDGPVFLIAILEPVVESSFELLIR